MIVSSSGHWEKKTMKNIIIEALRLCVFIQQLFVVLIVLIEDLPVNHWRRLVTETMAAERFQWIPVLE